MCQHCMRVSNSNVMTNKGLLAMLTTLVVVPKIPSRASDRRSQHSSARFVGRVPSTACPVVLFNTVRLPLASVHYFLIPFAGKLCQSV